ncbi:amidohydrolase family protein [Pseudokineococcus sp. 1T1Z-3]|uniref:amidohydrolase family protein n=1 Tax=Pseudokineococcus sp. 1T1Z-3 TaxID=3132745 RepID=UPI0030A43019
MSSPRLLRRDPRALAPPAGTVDVHLHVAADLAPGASSLRRDPGTPPPTDPAGALALLDEAGVDRALAFPPYRTGYAVANSRLREAAAASDGRLLAAARLGGRVPALVPAVWSVRRSLRSRVGSRPPDVDSLEGYAGVKLAPHVDGVPDEELLADVRARRLPVVVHAGVTCRPAWIARQLLPRLTGCRVVLAHLGCFPASAPALADAVALAREGRVWLDTSASWLAELVAVAVREAPGRVLFGSDAPLMSPRVAWQHVAAAVPDDALLDSVARGAAQEVLGL